MYSPGKSRELQNSWLFDSWHVQINHAPTYLLATWLCFPSHNGYFFHVTALSSVRRNTTDLEYLRAQSDGHSALLPIPQRYRSIPGAWGSCHIPKDDQRSDEREREPPEAMYRSAGKFEHPSPTPCLSVLTIFLIRYSPGGGWPGGSLKSLRCLLLRSFGSER